MRVALLAEQHGYAVLCRVTVTGLPAYDFDFVARVRVGLADNATQYLADCPTFNLAKVGCVHAPKPTCCELVRMRIWSLSIVTC